MCYDDWVTHAYCCLNDVSTWLYDAYVTWKRDMTEWMYALEPYVMKGEF